MKTITSLIFITLLSLPLGAFAQNAFLPDESPAKAAPPQADVLFYNAAAYTAESRPAKQYGIGVEVNTNYVPAWFLHIAMRGSH
ncbi:hypothetical protein KKF84_07585, partial [Myxococcota bacterium]|nr:hypothetical protein [Myxococcota bacterium]